MLKRNSGLQACKVTIPIGHSGNKHVKKIHIVQNASSTSASAYLLRALAEALDDYASCNLYHYNLKRSKLGKLKHFFIPKLSLWINVAKSQVLIVPTSAIYSLTQVIIAKLTGTKIVIILWDIYPESFLNYKKRKGTFIFRLYSLLEKRALRWADLVLLPSVDYQKSAELIGLNNTNIFPLWPFTDILEPRTERTDSNALHIGFAGTLNPIRGLPHAIDKLGTSYDGPLVLHLFSAERLNISHCDIPKNIKLIQHGFVDQDVLVARLRQLDAGLVCLNPEFDQPAFPSKIVSYIASGIPIIYSGVKSNGISTFLETHHVGISLTDERTINFEKELRLIKSSFAEYQKSALSYLALSEEKIAQIL